MIKYFGMFFTILLTLYFNNMLLAQENVILQIKACLAPDDDDIVVEYFQSRSFNEQKFIEYINSGHCELPSTSVNSTKLYVGEDYAVLVWIEKTSQNKTTYEIIDPEKFKINWVVPGQTVDQSTVPDQRKTQFFAATLPYKVDQVKHGSQIIFTVTTDDNKRQIFYFKVLNRGELYNIGDIKIGLWIPVGLFGTDFGARENGIEFSGAPINIAFGGKTNFDSPRFQYIGYSAVIGWNIYEPKTDDGATDGGAEKSYIKNLSLGLLLDISNYGYLGGGYSFPTSDIENGDPLIIFGFGPTLIDLLK